MVKLSEESKKKIESYVSKGYLNQDIVLKVWRDFPKQKILKTLKSYLFINEITLTKVWLFVIQEMWKDIDSIFDKREIILLKILLISDGVLLRTEIKNNSLNEYMTSKAIDSLNERQIVEVLSFSKNEKIVILHPRFRNKIFNEDDA